MESDSPTYHTFLIIISMCIILANTYAISLFMRYRSLLTKANLLLLSLAISEFMTGAVNIPSMIHAETLKVKNITKMITADILTVMCAAITMITLCGIIIDRYLVICFPLKYVSIVTKRKVVLLIVISWVLPFIMSFVRLAWLAPLLSITPQQGKNTTFQRVMKHALQCDQIYYISGTCIYLIIIAVLAVLFVLMFLAIRRLGKDEMEFTTETQDHAIIKRETKAVIIFAVMYVAFILCWTPLVVFRLLASVFPVHYNKIPPEALHTLIIIKYLTSVINPSLYILYKFEFYKEFQRDWNKLRGLCGYVDRKRRRRPTRSEITEGSFMSTNGGEMSKKRVNNNGYHEQYEAIDL